VTASAGYCDCWPVSQKDLYYNVFVTHATIDIGDTIAFSVYSLYHGVSVYDYIDRSITVASNDRTDSPLGELAIALPTSPSMVNLLAPDHAPLYHLVDRLPMGPLYYYYKHRV